jgi:hypothetical protein
VGGVLWRNGDWLSVFPWKNAESGSDPWALCFLRGPFALDGGKKFFMLFLLKVFYSIAIVYYFESI